MTKKYAISLVAAAALAATIATVLNAQVHRFVNCVQVQASTLATTGGRLCSGTGTPESSVSGWIGDMFMRRDGGPGTTLYVKESGSNTTTGWVAVTTAVEKRWFTAGSCNNTTPASDWSFPTSNPGVLACVTGTNTQKAVLDFADGGSALSVQRTILLPADFLGAVDARFMWHTTATSGAVVWQMQTTCVADGETGDPAFNTASTVTDTAKGTTNQYNEASITGVTTTGCAAGEMLYLKVTRDPADGGDTLAATARLTGVEVTLRRGL